MVKYGAASGDKCVCGAAYRSTEYDALDLTHDVVRCVTFSCDTPDCSGNIAEKWDKKLKEIAKHVKEPMA